MIRIRVLFKINKNAAKIKTIPIMSDVSTFEITLPNFTAIFRIVTTKKFAIEVTKFQKMVFIFHFSHKRKKPNVNNPKTSISKSYFL